MKQAVRALASAFTDMQGILMHQLISKSYLVISSIDLADYRRGDMGDGRNGRFSHSRWMGKHFGGGKGSRKRGATGAPSIDPPACLEFLLFRGGVLMAARRSRSQTPGACGHCGL